MLPWEGWAALGEGGGGAREVPKVTTVSRIARGTCNKLPQQAPDGVRPKRRAQKSGDYTVRT